MSAFEHVSAAPLGHLPIDLTRTSNLQAARGLGELDDQRVSLAVDILGTFRRAWRVLDRQRARARTPAIADNLSIQRPRIVLDGISHREAEHNCRIYCRPIHTGLGLVTVRPISLADAGLAQVFVIGLSGTARYFRFFQALQCLSPAMLDRFTRTDHVTHVALAGLAALDGAQRMVAEARYAVDADGTSAEIALAVTDLWQRRGIARELMATLERIAVAAGITRLTGECLAVNEGFASLARSMGFQVRSDTTDCCLLRIEKHIGGGSETWAATCGRFLEGGTASIVS